MTQLSRSCPPPATSSAAVDCAVHRGDPRRARRSGSVDRGYGGATPEPTETITVGLSQNQAGYHVGKANTVAFTVEPSPRPVRRVRSAAVRAADGHAGEAGHRRSAPTPLEVNEGEQRGRSRSPPPRPATDLTVDLTIGGDATGGDDPDDGDDYLDIDNSLRDARRQTTFTITVPVFVDQVKEDARGHHGVAHRPVRQRPELRRRSVEPGA